VLVHDLPQEVPNHEPVREEEPVAEVVLDHNFSGRTLLQDSSFGCNVPDPDAFTSPGSALVLCAGGVQSVAVDR
jgi:hypothetical protein